MFSTLRVCVCASRWISVLSNSKQEALNVALDGKRRGGGGGGGAESSVDELTRAITDDIRRMPGNSHCCDCGAPGEKKKKLTPVGSVCRKSERKRVF